MALVDSAVARIRELIRSGELRPGAKLPPESQLAAQLGMSRNPMREAVKILAAARVLDVRQGDGTYVTSLSPQLLFEGLGVGVEMLRDGHLLEVLEVRRMLEPAATAAAAARLGADDLVEIAGHLDAMTETSTDAETMVRHDMAFHRRIVVATGNEFLTSVLDGVSRNTLRARVWRGLIDEGSALRTLDEHRAIFEALRERNPELAHAAALMHVNTSEAWLRRMMTDPAWLDPGRIPRPETPVAQARPAPDADRPGYGASAPGPSSFPGSTAFVEGAPRVTVVGGASGSGSSRASGSSSGSGSSGASGSGSGSFGSGPSGSGGPVGAASGSVVGSEVGSVDGSGVGSDDGSVVRTDLDDSTAPGTGGGGGRTST